MFDRVAVLHPDQVWDVSRECFFLGLQPTKQKHIGEVVYKDVFGRLMVIVGRA